LTKIFTTNNADEVVLIELTVVTEDLVKKRQPLMERIKSRAR